MQIGLINKKVFVGTVYVGCYGGTPKVMNDSGQTMLIEWSKGGNSYIEFYSIHPLLVDLQQCRTISGLREKTLTIKSSDKNRSHLP